MNLMDVDGVNSEDALPSSPDPVVFDQTVVEEFPPVYNLARYYVQCIQTKPID